MNNNQITVQLPLDIFQRIMVLSEQTGIKRTVMVRRLLEDRIDALEKMYRDTKRKGKQK